MIYFLADNHYGARPGAMLYEVIRDEWEMCFREDDWSPLAEPDFAETCELLILNMIAGTGTAPPPGPAHERQVRAYVAGGGNLLLLHGASAAFWPWDWWRPIVGFRWVRRDDPDAFAPSTHPTRPYRVAPAKTRHPLAATLTAMDLPADEIYTDLEQTCPATVLMTTTTDEGTFPMCYQCRTPAGGTVLAYLPGHRREAVQHPDAIANCRVLIEALLSES